MLDLFRLLVVVFLVMHGIGHIIWFLAAWTPFKAGVGDGPWILPGDVTISSPVGKMWGLLALVVLVLFLSAAAGLVLQETWWVGATNLGVILSFAAVVPWVRQSPRATGINAIVANLILMFLLALPLSVELTGVT